jgi:RNA polymerase sigma-70 factor (ECF subfamily)
MAAVIGLREADGTMALPMIETEVVLRARRGDRAAFARIVELYQKPIFNYVLRMLGDREVAEEVTQDVFLRVHQNLHRFSFRAKFTTWLFRIAKNRALDELRSDPRRSFRAVLEENTVAVDDAPVEQAETIDAIWRAVEELPAELKTCLLLRDVAGFSYAEIMEVADASLPTVKWRIYRARELVARSVDAPRSNTGLAEAVSIPRIWAFFAANSSSVRTPCSCSCASCLS